MLIVNNACAVCWLARWSESGISRHYFAFLVLESKTEFFRLSRTIVSSESSFFYFYAESLMIASDLLIFKCINPKFTWNR